MLDEREFLSPYGLRALSRIHQGEPYLLPVDGQMHRVDYEPGESTTGLFGGNSNWRGPIWFPVNFLLVEALQKFHHYSATTCASNARPDRAMDDSGRSGNRPVAAAVGSSCATTPAGGPCSAGSERFHTIRTARLRALPRVFPRRRWPRPRRVPPTGWTALVAKLLAQSGAAPAAVSSASRGAERDRRSVVALHRRDGPLAGNRACQREYYRQCGREAIHRDASCASRGVLPAEADAARHPLARPRAAADTPST